MGQNVIDQELREDWGFRRPFGTFRTETSKTSHRHMMSQPCQRDVIDICFFVAGLAAMSPGTADSNAAALPLPAAGGGPDVDQGPLGNLWGGDCRSQSDCLKQWEIEANLRGP